MKIAITGGNSFLISLALKRLLDLPEFSEIHVFDLYAPHIVSEKIVFHRLNLTADDTSETVAKILTRNHIDTFIHGALFSGPTRNRYRHHEVESIGTFHILNACAEAQIKRLIVTSATFIYGALPKNPNYIKENYPLKSQKPYFVKTRIDVESQIQDFAKNYKNTKVLVLRFAPILGPNSTNIRSRYFLSGIVPKVLGYDPLLQFIHEEDALKALMLALRSEESGVYNIVGKGIIALSTAVHLSGKLPVPFPPRLCKIFFAAGYSSYIWNLPPEMVPFFQYLCVADGCKAHKKLGFRAKYSSRQALKAIIEVEKLKEKGFIAPTPTLGEERPVQTQGYYWIKQ